MFKKSIPYILLCLLVVTVVLGVMILVQLKAEPADEVDGSSIVGTYANGDSSSSQDLTYLVMDRDGSYLIYKQLAKEAIDRGSYKDGPDGKYIMESSMTDKYEAVLDDGCIYLAGEERTILSLEKYSNVPEYINFSK